MSIELDMSITLIEADGIMNVCICSNSSNYIFYVNYVSFMVYQLYLNKTTLKRAGAQISLIIHSLCTLAINPDIGVFMFVLVKFPHLEQSSVHRGTVE